MKALIFTCLSLLLPAIAQANGTDAARAEPETFQEPVTTQLEPLPALRLPPAILAARAVSAFAAAAATSSPTNAITLPALSDSEIQSLRNAPNQKAFQVGIGRDLPDYLRQPIQLDSWQWTNVSGGKVAHYTLTSTDAVRVRAQVQLSQAPAGVELRFYSPNDTSVVFGPYTATSEPFWSPTVEGDTLGLELFLPDGVATSEVSFAIARLSHLVVNPANSQMKSDLNTFREEYASCQQDIACADPSWQATGKAVARYVFTDIDGYSYICSGTVLTDKDVYTQIPYFFTAAHCVSNQTAASSMEMYWLYANSSCGGSGAVAVRTTGGATLLATKTALDTTLVRLNQNPPSGTTLSGWTVTPLTSNQAVTGIHHALGDPLKYAQGNFVSFASVTTSSGGYTVANDPNGDFSKVVWHTGITAPGSSGSGVWVDQGGVHYLNGSLLGGSSECSAMDAPDEYSRFERTWPYVSAWLGSTGTPPSLRLFDANQPATALLDGIVITRYLQGARGSALLDGVTTRTPDLAALESQLASVMQIMDVDDDGVREAGTDGVLLMRYLLGLRGAPLLQGLDVGTSTRNTPTAVSTYLESILNPAS
ncbi:MAG: trypsin-like peptidase domain-containing protein [Thiothrix sp.]